MKNCIFFRILIYLATIFIVGCSGGDHGGQYIYPNVKVINPPINVANNVRSSSTWYVINSNPPFGARDHASILKVNNRIHLLGGFYRGPSTYQDYWISDDFGVNWIHIHGEVLPLINNLTYPIIYKNSNIPDSYARFAYFDSRYWLIDDKIWYSNDALIWFSYAGLNGDVASAVDLVNINLGGKLVSIDPGNNLVWTIGTSFNRSGNTNINPEFTKRNGAAVYYNNGYAYIAGGLTTSYGVDFNGKKIVTGQSFNNNIWQSLDGVVWQRLIDSTGADIKLPWANVEWPCVVNDNQGRTWLIGGYDYTKNQNVSDVWFSSDGIAWTKYEDNIPVGGVSVFSPRHATACVFDDVNSRIISIAGKGGISPDNDSAFVTKDIIAIPIQ